MFLVHCPERGGERPGRGGLTNARMPKKVGQRWETKPASESFPVLKRETPCLLLPTPPPLSIGKSRGLGGSPGFPRDPSRFMAEPKGSLGCPPVRAFRSPFQIILDDRPVLVVACSPLLVETIVVSGKPFLQLVFWWKPVETNHCSRGPLMSSCEKQGTQGLGDARDATLLALKELSAKAAPAS